MPDTILVTYATRAGATAGVAEAIGKTLTDCGLAVEVRPMQDVTDLTPYRAVVAGSAVQNARWLPEALRWVEAHRAELSHKPFAAFLVCMTMSMSNPQVRENVKAWLDPVRALVHPVSEGFFAGALALDKVPSLRKRLMFRVSIAVGAWTEGDHRDWEAIHAWAAALPAQLQAVRQP